MTDRLLVTRYGGSLDHSGNRVIAVVEYGVGVRCSDSPSHTLPHKTALETLSAECSDLLRKVSSENKKVAMRGIELSKESLSYTRMRVFRKRRGMCLVLGPNILFSDQQKPGFYRLET